MGAFVGTSDMRGGASCVELSQDRRLAARHKVGG